MTMQDVLTAIAQQAASSTSDLIASFQAWFPYVLGLAALLLVLRIVINLIHLLIERITGR